ncbi:MAG TPA: hypothetical protein DEQ47_08705 [Solibacterales bacterium]|nr:hypothetical protein [Bryobacterales bacterium]
MKKSESEQITHFRTANPSSVRDVNRSIVLSLIRLHEPLSRAALSEKTGIFRSNISSIVDDLIETRLVREERATPNGRGRVPYLLSLRDDTYRVAAVSIRPITTSVACSGLTARPQKVLQFKTPAHPKDAVTQIASAVRQLKAEIGMGSKKDFGRIGVSVPGLVNAHTGEVLWIPALPDYAEFPLRQELEQQTGVKIEIDNDCNLGALADMRLRQVDMGGVKDFVFLEIGDIGVGAGLILNGELYRGHDARFVAEFGHMIVDPDGPKCRCGRRGCWELYVCDRATWRRFRPSASFSEESVERVIAASLNGEKSAIKALRQTARYLAIGISNIVLALNPQVIVVAGRIMESWDQLRPFVETEFAPSQIPIHILPARMAPEPLFLQGALSLALHDVFAQPALGW